MKVTIRIFDYKIVSENTIFFKAFSSIDSNRIFFIEYYFTDLNTDISLSNKKQSKLLEILKSEIGFAPFTKKLDINAYHPLFIEL